MNRPATLACNQLTPVTLQARPGAGPRVRFQESDPQRSCHGLAAEDSRYAFQHHIVPAAARVRPGAAAPHNGVKHSCTVAAQHIKLASSIVAKPAAACRWNKDVGNRVACCRTVTAAAAASPVQGHVHSSC
eukprot:jgi/Ulvmu1/5302/UM022_0096.1